MEKGNRKEVEEFINTLERSFLNRKKIKNINELSNEEVIELFDKIKIAIKGFWDYSDDIGKIVDNKRDDIINYRKKLEDDEFIKNMRYDRSLVKEGMDVSARLKSVPINNLKGCNIETITNYDNRVLKIKENINFKRKPQKMDLRDALKIENLEVFEVDLGEYSIKAYPISGISYRQNKIIEGNVQKYMLKITNPQTGKTIKEYIYTNSLDKEKYKVNEKYREKVKYLLSKENIKNSKKMKGYLGDITRDNRVVDDENNFVAISEYEEKGKRLEETLNKWKDRKINNEKGSNGER